LPFVSIRYFLQKQEKSSIIKEKKRNRGEESPSRMLIVMIGNNRIETKADRRFTPPK
jgi:hypothetical protein